MKDVDRRRDYDDDRENGTNGDDRKGSFTQDQVGKSLAELSFSRYVSHS